MKILAFISLFVINCIFAISQIPEGYYTTANGLTAEELKSALHDIIKGHTEFTYTSTSTDVWDILKETDMDTVNQSNVIMLYSSWTLNAASEYDNGSGWSREHVWAKSHGDFGTSRGAGTDAHHLRPADVSVNSARGNKDFDNGGDYYIDGDGATLCRRDADSWEARDMVKGDIARMLFYMAVRYEGEDDELDLELIDEVSTVDLNEIGKGYHGKLSTLLEWHIQDPVDDVERNRNNVIYSFQHNRNPFIDHPEYVDMLWGVVVSVAEHHSNSEFNGFVRNGELHIETSSLEKASAMLYTINGVLLKQFAFSGHHISSISSFDDGIYILQIVSKGENYSFKIPVSK